METMSFESEFQFGTLKVGDDTRDVMRLVVEHHSEDIKARIGVGVLKTPRFVNEYAQCLHPAATPYRPPKEKVAEIASHHQREDFPPHPDDPSCGKIDCIVSFLADNIKGATEFFGNGICH
jgi:hypothetical protein